MWGMSDKKKNVAPIFFHHNVLTIPCRKRISDFYNKILDNNLLFSSIKEFVPTFFYKQA